MGSISSRWSQPPVNQTQPVGEPEALTPWGGGYPEPWMPRTVDGPLPPPVMNEQPGMAFQPQPGLPQDSAYPPMQAGPPMQQPGGLRSGGMSLYGLGAPATIPGSWLSRGVSAATSPIRGVFSSFLRR